MFSSPHAALQSARDALLVKHARRVLFPRVAKAAQKALTPTHWNKQQRVWCLDTGSPAFERGFS
jgi:hypothetical protein